MPWLRCAAVGAHHQPPRESVSKSDMQAVIQMSGSLQPVSLSRASWLNSSTFSALKKHTSLSSFNRDTTCLVSGGEGEQSEIPSLMKGGTEKKAKKVMGSFHLEV